KALLDATEGLKQTAPELIDSLHQAVKPMQTFVEKREQLTSLINGGLTTVGTTRQAFDNHTDQLIGITTELTPVIGTFANNASKFQTIFQKATQLGNKWFEEPWKPEVDTPNMRVNLSMTPGSTYTR
ncbi:MCE family protein, partial [Mycobacteroides abscessus subsp. bolletii]